MYLNITSQIVSAASAGKTFTADITFQNFDNGSIQVTWTGVTGTAGFITIYGSNDLSNFSTLTASPSTMLTSTSSYLFNITDAGYNWVRAEYQPSGNATGTVNVYLTRKSRR